MRRLTALKTATQLTRTFSGSDGRQAVAGLWLIFWLHPAWSTRFENRPTVRPEQPAFKRRDQLRGLGFNLSRRLVLPAGHPRQLLSWRRLRLQHSCRPRQKRVRALPRSYGHGYDPRRRQSSSSRLEGRLIGPGHFGLLDFGPGVQKFSCHYEADLDRGGASVLDIRPLLWKDGWPIAGENLKEGTYEIESARTGTALELAVEGVPVGGRRVRGGFGPGPGGSGGGPGAGGATAEPFSGRGGVIPPQDVAQVSTNWPAGNVDVRLANYLCQAQQKWTFTAVTNAGGYFGSPVFQDLSRWNGPYTGCDRRGRIGFATGFHRTNPNNSGVWTNSQTAPGTSCPRWFPIPRSRSLFRQSAAVSLRSPSSIQTVTSNGGIFKTP